MKIIFHERCVNRKGARSLPAGWLVRLAGHAHASADIASVCAISQQIGFAGAPDGRRDGRVVDLPDGMPPERADTICREANAGRAVDVPGAAGACGHGARLPRAP